MSTDAKIIDLIRQGHGRTTILRMVPDATEWKIRNLLKQHREDSDLPAVTVDPRFGKSVVRHHEVIKDLQPLNITVTPEDLPPPSGGSQYTVAAFSDIHHPYSDPKALAVVKAILKYQRSKRLDAVVFLGDGPDFYSVSRYDKSPSRLNDLSEELQSFGKMFGQITQVVADVEEKIYIGGNHEARLAAYIATNAPALANLPQLKVDNLLGLKSLGWEYKPFHILKDTLMLTHGAFIGSEAGTTAKKEFDFTGMSGASGHCHRLAQYERTKWIDRIRGNQPSIWVESGCLCLAEDQEYTNRGHANWQQGMVMFQIHDGLVQPTLIRIHNGMAIYDGKVFRAND